MPDKLPPAQPTAPPPGSPSGVDMLEPRPGPLPRRRYISQQLFGDTTEVEILHGEAVYRLRLTSLGKLILTK